MRESKIPDVDDDVYDLDRIDGIHDRSFIGKVQNINDDIGMLTVGFYRRNMEVGPYVLSCGVGGVLWDARDLTNLQWRDASYVRIGGDELVLEDIKHYFLDDLVWSPSRHSWFVED